ncbi:MAG TPA: NAD(P)H-hydrate dehydratase [Candidatus Brocadiia bacterium]|nr:NAD(P)H-hydrate dehydratase [Candidatus Brocadiia bacterium]
MREIVELPRLPDRSPDAHKGDFGRVLVIAGSVGFTGAAYLCAKAALRSGAGLVTLACPETVYPILAAKHACVMVRPVTATDKGTVGSAALRELSGLCRASDAVAIGPGLGRHDETTMIVRELARSVAAPMVIDADGLNALAGDVAAIDNAAGPRILTPHPGEMARLLGQSGPGEIQKDRRGAAAEFLRRHPGVLVLKGQGTIVSDGQQFFTNPTGNPGMATGGTGDVLAGCIAALAGQGMEPFDAARLGVFLHGLAGDLAADELGEDSLIATDLLDRLPGAFKRYRDACGGRGAINPADV